MELEKILDGFEIRKLFTDKDIEKLKISSYVKSLKQGQIIQRDNNRCIGVPFVIKGELQLFSLSESGRKMNLYKVKKGELCILAALCIITEKPYEFIASAEEDTEIIMIRSNVFKELVDNNSKFNRHILSLIADKLIHNLMLHEKVHLTGIRKKLISYLNKHSNKENVIKKTHEDIANDLGSSRVVISREISKLRDEKYLITRRKYIKILKY